MHRFALLLVALAVGCGGGRFVKADATASDLARDRRLCDEQARQRTEPRAGHVVLGPALGSPALKRHLFDECMAANGWARK